MLVRKTYDLENQIITQERYLFRKKISGITYTLFPAEDEKRRIRSRMDNGPLRLDLTAATSGIPAVTDHTTAAKMTFVFYVSYLSVTYCSIHYFVTRTSN